MDRYVRTPHRDPKPGNCVCGETTECPLMTCQACGTPQCYLAPQCLVCIYGIFPVDRTCYVSKCVQPAVASSRQQLYCRDHLNVPWVTLRHGTRITLKQYIELMLTYRDDNFELVSR